MPERPDFTFGAKRWDPDSVLSAHPALRRRSGRRDLQAKVPRNLPAISAPERNIAKSIADTGAGALSALMGGDERERVQRASDISDVLSYVNPVEGVERAFLHGFQQLQGGPSAGVADYINLALPAAGLAGGPLTRAAGKMVPQGLKDWLAVSRAIPEVDGAIAGQFAVRETPQLAARPRSQVRALPAPEPQLALPHYEAPASPYHTKPRPPLRENYLTDIAHYAPVVWRETNVERANHLLPTSRASTELGDLFVADSPDLALGQHKNTGVLMEFDSGRFRGQVNRGKPAWDTMWDEGLAEYLLRGNLNRQHVWQEQLRRLTVKPGAETSRVNDITFKRALQELEERGWSKENTAHGLVYTRPDVKP